MALAIKIFYLAAYGGEVTLGRLGVHRSLHPLIGAAVTMISVLSGALLLYRNSQVSLAVWAGLQIALGLVLFTSAVAQRRKRKARRTMELGFLNHHIRNALVQVQLAEYARDAQRQRELLDEAIERIASALTRVTNTSDLDLSIKNDPTGKLLMTAIGASSQVGTRRDDLALRLRPVVGGCRELQTLA